MTEDQLRALGPALDRFLAPFLFCCGYTQTFEHLRSYCRGLLSDLPRKSAEPIALACGTPVRTLQEFLRDHAWDHSQMTDVLQQHAAAQLGALPDDGLGTVGIIDETGQPKKGRASPGVARQWCGRLGKLENCVVTVHLGVARGRFTALLGGDLFLPQSWADDRERCRQAGIPEEVVHRPKWRIALEQLQRAGDNGVVLDWLTFDEGYGNIPEFMAELTDRGQRFVGETPRSLACRVAAGEVRPLKAARSRRAEVLLVAALAGQGVAVGVPRESTADEVWQAVEMAVWLRQGRGWSPRSYRLLAAYNARTEEVKYFVSNAPAEVGLDVVVRAAFRRAPIEHAIAIQKGDLGFGHYEGRSYRGLLRHQSICAALGVFVAEQSALARVDNAEVTGEQVCRGLGVVCWLGQHVRRGLDQIAAAAGTIAYHQRRNKTARESQKKRFVLPRFWIVPESRMSFHPAGLSP